MASHDPKLPPKQLILEYLLHTKELRKDLKAQAARVLRHHRSVSSRSRSALRNSIDLIPQLLKQEVETLAPLVASRNPSLSISKRKLEVVDLPLAAAPNKVVSRKDSAAREVPSPEQSARTKKQSIPRMPPAKPFKPNIVLQRVYGPQKKELQDLTARPVMKPRTQSQARVRKSVALLRPVLQSYRCGRHASKSAIGDASTHGSDSHL